jgi:hypothetical protein
MIVTAMQPPPPTLDGAKVLKVADLAAARAAGRTRHYVGSERVTDFASIALAQYDDDPAVYIFYATPTGTSSPTRSTATWRTPRSKLRSSSRTCNS